MCRLLQASMESLSERLMCMKVIFGGRLLPKIYDCSQQERQQFLEALQLNLLGSSNRTLEDFFPQ